MYSHNTNDKKVLIKKYYWLRLKFFITISKRVASSIWDTFVFNDESNDIARNKFNWVAVIIAIKTKV